MNDVPVQSAKASFIASIQHGMNVLMQECGYSRERASAVLLRELQRTGRRQRDTGTSLRPTDEEVFYVMKRYNLNMEDSTRALIVSKAFQRELADIDTDDTTDGPSTNVAIDKLVSRLSRSNLLYESDSSVDTTSDDEDDQLTIRRDLLVNPIASLSIGSSLQPLTRNDQAMIETLKHSKARKQSRKHTSKKSNSTTAVGRKRKVEEVGTPTEKGSDRSKQRTNKEPGPANGVDGTKITTRPRVDSVTMEVDAKISSGLPTSRPKRMHSRSGAPDEEVKSSDAIVSTRLSSGADSESTGNDINST